MTRAKEKKKKAHTTNKTCMQHHDTDALKHTQIHPNTQEALEAQKANEAHSERLSTPVKAKAVPRVSQVMIIIN
jgi:hypothetical protein